AATENTAATNDAARRLRVREVISSESISHRSSIPERVVLPCSQIGRAMVLIDVQAPPYVAAEVVPDAAAERDDVVRAVFCRDEDARAIAIGEALRASARHHVERTEDLLRDRAAGAGLQIVGLVDFVRVLHVAREIDAEARGAEERVREVAARRQP